MSEPIKKFSVDDPGHEKIAGNHKKRKRWILDEAETIPEGLLDGVKPVAGVRIHIPLGELKEGEENGIYEVSKGKWDKDE